MRNLRLTVSAFAFVLAAMPALAADRVIYNGIDLWFTAANGSTFVDFADNPLPAGFFCYKSEPFAGRIGFKGVPVASSEPGVLGRSDTVVQRLDDAVFNKRGTAYTRLQVRSLNFESISPIETACGQFTAKVTLDGEQPITRMKIVRENAKGGRFFAPISVNIKIGFEPVGRPAMERLEILKSLRFPPLANQRWETLSTRRGNQVKGFILIDTDGDRTPDTYLPGTSNFGVGQVLPTKVECAAWEDPEGNVHCCHRYSSCQHCVD